MLRVMLQKLWHKKWMVFCMLLGSVLLVATVISFPLYKTAAFDRMLQEEFEDYLAEEGVWPAKNEMTIISKKDNGGKTIARMEELMANIHAQLGVEKMENVLYYSLAKAEVNSVLDRDDLGELSLRLGFLSDLPAHASMLAGEMYSEDGLLEDGSIAVVISEACMVSQNLLVGEQLEFDALKDVNKQPVRMTVVGVFGEEDKDDFYWQVDPDTLDNVMLMDETLFRNMFTGENAGKYTISCSYYPMFTYENLKDTQVEQLIAQTDYLTEESPYKSTISDPAYRTILDSYERKRDRIEATLFILQVPVLVLLCAFLFMISGQMYDMERNEISVLKSRGSSGGQIFRLYLYQSIFLTLLGVAAGLPLGGCFCRILGSAVNFLEFSLQGDLQITFGKEAAIYTATAGVVSVLVMTMPAIKHSRVNIVKLKQQKAQRKRSFWEICFLDIICLGVALYGYYNYSRNQELLVRDVLMGEALDPLLYMSSSLLIVGAGLLFLRLQPLLIKLLFKCGQRFWHPASYASFLENLKNGRKQQFIMLFMILTISLGMFHATVARTILQNAQDNVAYLDGADVIIKEVWSDNSAFASNDSVFAFQYFEPDFDKYATLSCAKSYTKVIYDEAAYISGGGNSRVNLTLMGIHTRQFGENTDMDDSLLEKPYHEYLNELAVTEKGLLVSRNFESLLGYKAGDSITYYDKDKNQATGKIVDFFDYWPGYEPTTTQLGADGSVVTTDNYLLVTHFSLLQQNWGTVPYEVWITLKDDADTGAITEWIAENDLRITKYVNKQADLQKTIEEPLLQGTNGVLTMGFMVTILLCAVGYLIYWIMSIRAREMMFGVLRACGMHKRELFHMLINEQLFSGVLSILAGIVIGKISSAMFVPMLQTAYAAANQVLPMRLIVEESDMYRLYGVTALVMAVCLLVLIILVFKLNVAKALKLGEE